jgi:hypothetical protein
MMKLEFTLVYLFLILFSPNVAFGRRRQQKHDYGTNVPDAFVASTARTVPQREPPTETYTVLPTRTVEVERTIAAVPVAVALVSFSFHLHLHLKNFSIQQQKILM